MAMTGKEELAAVLAEMNEAVDGNPCAMSDKTMRGVADALRRLWRTKVPKTYTREQAALALGISTRQLQRDMASAGIRPHRKGSAVVWLTEDDVERLRALRMRK